MTYHQRDYQHHLTTYLRARIGIYILAAIAAGLSAWGVSELIRGNTKTGYGITAVSLTVGVVGSLTSPIAQNTSPILRDYRDASDDVRQNQIFQDFSEWNPPSTPDENPISQSMGLDSSRASLNPVAWFDWDLLLKQPDTYPHLAFVASTGSGKSTLAEWMASKVEGLNFALAPHWKPGDFSKADIVLCQGRNFGYDSREYEILETKSGEKIIGEFPVKFDDILQGKNPTYCQFMRSLLDEMDRRYRLRERGELDLDGDHPRLNILCDEYNAVAKLPGMKQCLSQLLRESRKVGIRLFLLIQSDQVKSLGIEGEGDLRFNLSYVRMGGMALDHLRWIVEKMRANHPNRNEWETLWGELQQEKRPCMVEDQPAKVPDLSGESSVDAVVQDTHVATETNGNSQVQPVTMVPFENDLDEDLGLGITRDMVATVKRLHESGLPKTKLLDGLGFKGRKRSEAAKIFEDAGVNWLLQTAVKAKK